MHPDFQVCLLGKHVGKEVLITLEMSLVAITEVFLNFHEDSSALEPPLK